MEILIGFVIDFILGDPYNLPHPVRWIGNLISGLDRLMYREEDSDKKKFIKGMILAIIVIVVTVSLPLIILFFTYKVNKIIGIFVEGVMCYYLIAPKSLKKESMKVCKELEKGNTKGARYAVSMIVGRDTESLDEKGIAKAAVETVAENTSDGVTAPIMYIVIGGAGLGFLYKAVNTMDSMIGYKNDKYMYFGRFAAKLDDVLNYIPSRVTALFMIAASGILGYDFKSAFRIWRRDRRKHKSPNSAQTEAVCAGALGLELAGDAYYFGKLVKKDTIGDNKREIEARDIKRVNNIMYVTSVMVLVICVAIRFMIRGIYG